MGAIDTAANIALCNFSLGYLGSEAITLNGTTQNHTYCETFFEKSRDEILASHKWNLAKKRAFAIQTTDPLFGYDNAFTKPTDCLKVWTIEQDPLAEFEVEGSTIVTDEGTTPDEWDDDTYYEDGDYVSHNDITFECLADHHSSLTTTEPSVGALTDTYWKNFVTTAGTNPSAWAIGGTYVDGDFVINDEVIYECVATKGSAAAAADEPGTGANYKYYWQAPTQNHQILEVEYCYQATDVSTYPAYLYQCVVYNLALKLVSPIKQNEEVAFNLQAMLYGGPRVLGYLNVARSIDGQEGTGKVIKTQKWLDSRK